MNNPNIDRCANVAWHLKTMAARSPYQKAVIEPCGHTRDGLVAYRHLTFRQLDKASDRLAHGFETAGIGKNSRTVLMVPFSIDFFKITFALFKVGAIPVLVDPGMGVKRMIACLKHTDPTAFIGIPKAHVARLLNPKAFAGITTHITVGNRWFWRGPTLQEVQSDRDEPFQPVPRKSDDTAAILFTTGSTGPAKGAVYTHGIFNTQIDIIRKHFGIGDDEIDLPTFPLFALFDPALGMTAVIPDMDPTRPATANPVNIAQAIVDHGVTNMFASPALLNRLGQWGRDKKICFPALRRVVSAGAPVLPENIAVFSKLLTGDAGIYTPYGATEAMPVTSISGKEILTQTRKKTEQGFGVCVGQPVAGIDLQIITICDEPIKTWSSDLTMGVGAIGEIVVSGAVVTRQYYNDANADALHKIYDNAKIWHRMGDLGWRDNQGRVWFCGRKSHRVVTEKETLYTIPVEAIFNQHPAVFRSALVGVGEMGAQTAVICIELIPDTDLAQEAIEEELLKIAVRNPLTRPIEEVRFHPGFPVDVRHNAKIFREKLAVWVENG